MFSNLLIGGQAFSILSDTIMKEPGFTQPIVAVLGFVLNIIFNMVYRFTETNSLGIAIIFFTILVRLCMVPLAVKQQKSMVKMQEIQPMIKEIQDKYKDNKDPEVQKKMQLETQKVYRENKVNPLSGCLPLFIQLPIFMSLSYIMNNAYLFVNKLGDLYYQLADTILNSVNFSDSSFSEPFLAMITPKIPNGMSINVNSTEGMAKLLNVFNPDDWANLATMLPPEAVTAMTAVFEQKSNIEYFLGIDLTGTAGLSFPGILIPIMAAASTFLSSYLSFKLNPNAASDQAKQQQKIMLIVMPIMMGFMTINLSAGVGVYWITSSVFQVFQQLLLNHNIRKKFHMGRYDDEHVAEREEKLDEIEGKFVEKKEQVEKKIHKNKKK